MTESKIREHLKTKIFGRRMYSLDSIDSTNTHLKSLAVEGAEEGTLVITEEQTAGKGRLGRTWQTQKGMNLTFSVLLRPNISANHLGIISIAAGVAVAEAIQELCKIQAECKWPNDILFDDKKLCGILCESVISPSKFSAVIVGIGVNVNQTMFPTELNDIATSIARATGTTADRAALLAKILERLEFWYDKIQSDQTEEIIVQWKKNTTMLGKKISVNRQGAVLDGIAKEVDADGSLIFQTNGGEINIHSGDVTIIHS